MDSLGYIVLTLLPLLGLVLREYRSLVSNMVVNTSLSLVSATNTDEASFQWLSPERESPTSVEIAKLRNVCDLVDNRNGHLDIIVSNERRCRSLGNLDQATV